MKSLRIFLLCVFVVSCTPDLRASDPLMFRSEGPFVSGPSMVGGVIVAAPCAIVGFVWGLPFLNPIEGAKSGAGGGFLLGSAAVGAPFFVLKKVFYDCPKSLIEYRTKPKDLPAPVKPEDKP